MGTPAAVSQSPIEIVHLAHTFFPADPRVKREALAAAATGRHVAVVALRGPAQEREERIGPLTVIRLPGGRSRAGPWAYLAEYTAFLWRCRRLLSRDPRFSGVRVVHVHTLPDFLVWAATPARRIGARLIVDLHEIFPEFTAAKYPGMRGRVAAWIARRLEANARHRADVTITVNRPIEELLRSRGIGRVERLLVIHNSADPDDFGPSMAPRTTARGEPLDLIYHGTLTSLYGLETAIRGVAHAVRQGLPTHLTVLGEGPERQSLSRLVTELEVDQAVTFEPPLPQRALRERISRVDAGVVPTHLDGMTQYSLSNKLLEYVHLGVPILAARLPSYGRYLAENAAWFWSPGNPEDFAGAIRALTAASPQERAARASRAQQNTADITWSVERERLIALYNELLATP